MKTTYHGRDVLVTGGLGFLGSNLVIRLVKLGARVTVVDSLVRGCGGNPYNIAPVADCVRVLRCNIAATEKLREVIRTAHIIFNLAGEISHIHSMRCPRRDARLNVSAQLAFLEECSRTASGIRIVYAGTRQIFGVPRYLPVDEEHPICPVDFNGIHKSAAIMYHLLYSRMDKLDAIILNFSNLYGPRLSLLEPCQGFLANFVRMTVTRQRLEVFGDGRQLRDPMYVDDAVDALLAVGAADRPPSRTYNVGGPEPIEIGRIAEIASRIAGLEPPLWRPFPAEKKAIDIGSYYTDLSRIRRELGWAPSTRFEEGIGRTFAFYRNELPNYLDPRGGQPRCRLSEAFAHEQRAVASL